MIHDSDRPWIIRPFEVGCFGLISRSGMMRDATLIVTSGRDVLEFVSVASTRLIDIKSGPWHMRESARYTATVRALNGELTIDLSAAYRVPLPILPQRPHHLKGCDPKLLTFDPYLIKERKL